MTKTFHIKGSIDEKAGQKIDQLQIEQGCQTCFGTFDITLSYELGHSKSVTVTVSAQPTSANNSHRDITAK
jgi:hypothetical protein